jgi:hypothetical protein
MNAGGQHCISVQGTLVAHVGRQPWFRIALALALGLALQGCAAVSYYRSEAAGWSPPPFDGRASTDHSVTLRGREVDVSVDARNHTTDAVWIMLLPLYYRGTHPG